MKKIAVLILLFAAVLGCRRSDIRELTVEMTRLEEADRPLIAKALSKYSGVKADSFKWDFDKKTLTLKYESMSIAATNIRMAIEQQGVEVVYPPNTSGRAGY